MTSQITLLVRKDIKVHVLRKRQTWQRDHIPVFFFFFSFLARFHLAKRNVFKLNDWQFKKELYITVRMAISAVCRKFNKVCM